MTLGYRSNAVDDVLQANNNVNFSIIIVDYE